MQYIEHASFLYKFLISNTLSFPNSTLYSPPLALAACAKSSLLNKQSLSVLPQSSPVSPRLDDIHPFYADLCNALYDKDRYKLALGQINTARSLVDAIARDMIRMVKYGDSLYRCKCLKRAALGRMCTGLKHQKASLAYLDEVRKHMSRLPAIDPNTRTLLMCGLPNVGKSSFMNKFTRAEC